MDDESRENEGDIIMAAQFCTPEAMAKLIRFTSGIVCVPMLAERAAALRLHPMVPPATNEDAKGTAYTVSCDFVGSHTGISAAERCRTATVLAEPVPDPTQLSRPGHVFPLIAKDGGVLERRGHTEAAVDLCRMAGVVPVGVISELMNDDGSTSLLPECIRFARQHGMPIVTIDAMVEYRKLQAHQSVSSGSAAAAAAITADSPDNAAAAAAAAADSSGAATAGVVEKENAPAPVHMQLLSACTIPVVRGGKDLGNWQMQIYSPVGRATSQSSEHHADDHTIDIVAMVKLDNTGDEGGNIGNGAVGHQSNGNGATDGIGAGSASPVFRMHSQCITGDLLGSTRCDCGEQLSRSFQTIHQAGAGAVVYIPGHEGRGIGLIEKVKAYRLMEDRQDIDTYAANVALGHPADVRSYDGAAAVVKKIFMDKFHPHGARSLTLLTGNPSKAEAIAVRLLDSVAAADEVRVASLDMAPRASNKAYLAAKAEWASSSWGPVGDAFCVAQAADGFVLTRRSGNGQVVAREHKAVGGLGGACPLPTSGEDGVPASKAPKLQ